MELGKLLAYFDSSPAVKLLRAQSGPFVAAFLFRQFKQSDTIAIPHSTLLPALASFQEDIQESYPEALRDRPETYLAEWCSGERRWLHRFLEQGREEPVYQLTSHSEDVLEFLDRALEQDLGFVGTESRLRLIIDTLEALVIGASEDPEVHLKHLRKEQERIAREIERIEREGTVAAYRPARIREQFATAVALLKQLQGDFRAVEEKFREITRKVQQRQLHGLDSRGGILGDVLDAEDALRTEDQGVSFYEFFRFIQSPQQQDRLRAIIRDVGRIRELVDQADGLEAVRRMMPLLLAEAGKVTQTERRLSATLRRLLDVRAQRERQRVAELLRDIRGLAMNLSSNPPRALAFLEVDAGLALASPMSRTFWSEPPRFERMDLKEHVSGDDRRRAAFRQFAELHRIDFSAMRSRIREAVKQRGRVTLSQMLFDHPPRSGMMDVLGYLQIAHDDGHIINEDAQEEVVLPKSKDAPSALAVTVPLVTFVDGKNQEPGKRKLES